MLVGGGMLAAFDGRSEDAVAANTGGILQLSRYVVGVSGGSWMTGSLANFPSFGCASSLSAKADSDTDESRCSSSRSSVGSGELAGWSGER